MMITRPRPGSLSRPSPIDDQWHAPILLILGLLLTWNMLTAWFGVQPRLNRYPSELELRASHFRIFVPAFAYAVIALMLGISRARRGGSVAGYGMAAVVAMLAAVAVMFTTFGIRTVG